MLVSKEASRLGLVLSNTLPTLKLRQDQIKVCGDITSDETGNVMTDGCGFIGDDLAMEVRFSGI
jgi:hypothetical protein